mgnify:CR=1 FL=1
MEEFSMPGNAQAESLLLEAIEIDPENARAWAELARLRWRVLGTGASARDDVQAIRDAINRSISIDPDDPSALAYLAASVGDFDGDIQQAAQIYQRAIALNPADEHLVRAGIIFLTNHGAAEDAIALGEYGLLRNPVCHLCADNLVYAYFRGQRYTEAEALARSIVALHDRGYWLVGQAMLLQGRAQEALDWFEDMPHGAARNANMAMAMFDLARHAESERLLESFPDAESPEMLQGIHVWAYAWTRRYDAAFSAFESMFEYRQKYGGETILRRKAWQMSRIAASPWMVRLHDDPRWPSLATKLGVSDEQRAALDFELTLPAAW